MLCSFPIHQKRRKRSSNRVLGIESLENRQLLSVTISISDATVAEGSAAGKKSWTCLQPIVR